MYLGLLCTYLVLMLSVAPPRFMEQLIERLDQVVYDLRFDFANNPAFTNHHTIVIVDYDQKSLEAEGQWPWSRFKLGDLVARLADLGVSIVGFDVFFPEAERNVARELERQLAQDAALQTEMAPLVPELQQLSELLDADRYFAQRMQRTDVVLGFSFQRGAPVQSGVLPPSIFDLEEAERWTTAVGEQQGYIGNIAVLQEAARGAGFFDTEADSDGVVRRYPLFMAYAQRLYPSLALEMARLYFFEERFTPVVETDLLAQFNALTGVRMGRVLISTDAAGRVLIPYKGRAGSFPYISATDILHGNLSSEQRALLEGSVVLVGTTSTGLYDLRPTPVQSVYPGVEIHATVLDALLDAAPRLETNGGGAVAIAGNETARPFPVRPDWQNGAQRTVIVLLGMALALLYPRLGPGWLAFASVGLVAGLVALNLQLWERYRFDTSLVLLLLLLLLITLINLAHGFLREEHGKKALKEMFGQYVPPAHIDAMLSHPERYNFDGESKELSVLFSDIRNFTAFSERLSAVELKTLLNDFFTPLTGIIFEHGGTIDKYVGDMVMAFWGAPLDDPRHREHAVAAALRMLQAVQALKSVFRARGLPEIDIGIGINSGMMNVGDMGSTYRRAYTVLGDAVNLGSRLEGITQAYGVNLLIGENTHAALDGVLCRRIDRVSVKGREQPVSIYQPLCLTAEADVALQAAVQEYEQAYQHYLERNWEAAREGFGVLQTREPEAVLYRLYLQRIEVLRRQQLPKNWDGTYSFSSKKTLA